VKVGDMVQYRHSLWGHNPDRLEQRLGTIVEIEAWSDSGAPDRNFGVHIHVMWSDGEIGQNEEDELEVISAAR
jgi:hypothetical protein